MTDGMRSVTSLYQEYFGYLVNLAILVILVDIANQ